MLDWLILTAFQNACVGSMMGAAVWLLTRIWKNQALAHWLWILVLVKFVTPPIWSIPLPMGSIPTRHEVPPGQEYDVASHALDDFAHSRESSFGSLRSGTARSGNRGLSYAAVFAGVWLAGSAIFLVVLVRRVVTFDRLQRRTARVSTRLERLARRLSIPIGLRRPPVVKTLDAAVPPLVWCPARTATILLPSHLLEHLPNHEVEAIVAHELIHVRRFDHRVRQLQLAVLGLYWWNPIAWLVAAELIRTEEECCDATVVGSLGISPLVYAKTLLDAVCFLRWRTSIVRLPATGFGKSGHLKRRMEVLLDGTRTVEPTRAVSLTVCLSAALLPFSLETVETVRNRVSNDAATPTAQFRASEVGPEREQIVSEAFPADRLRRPYGELGFPGDQFGPHWEVVRLATHPPVLEEIDADAVQQAQLALVRHDLMQHQRQWRQAAFDHTLLQSEADRVAHILSPRQELRIEQLILQRRGLPLLLDAQIGRRLEMTPQQTSAIASSWQRHVRRVRARNRLMDDHFDRPEAGRSAPLMDALRAELRAQAGRVNRESHAQAWQESWNVLTNAQRSAYEQLLGPPVGSDAIGF